jgi:hypothetical protein
LGAQIITNGDLFYRLMQIMTLDIMKQVYTILRRVLLNRGKIIEDLIRGRVPSINTNPLA